MRRRLSRCHAALGETGQPGALEVLFDDSYMGAVGINTMMVELERRSLSARVGSGERPSIDHGLAPHERALAS